MRYIPILMIALLALSACTSTTTTPQPQDTNVEYLDSEELRERLRGGEQDYDLLAQENVRRATADSSAESAQAPTAAGMGSDGSASYSETNIQEAGVDEADIIKTDGERLYLLSGETFIIIDATNPDDAHIESEVVLKGSPQDLFLDSDENRVVIFTQSYEEREHWPEYSILPTMRSNPLTRAYSYDVSGEEPELLDTVEMSGSYQESRLQDGAIYAITHESPRYGDIIVEPFVRTSQERISPRIGYFDRSSEQYTTIARFTTAAQSLEAQTYLTGHSQSVYMSEDALYLAYQTPYEYDEEERSSFYDVVLPALPQDLQEEIETIRRMRIAQEEQWRMIAEAMSEYEESLEEQEREEYIERIEEAVSEHESEQALERARTTIQKINLELEHEASGEVKGTLHNQFSLDEHEGTLRVATTLNVWTREERIQHNNVYVLDQDLAMIGSLEGLAEDEQIYSTRFMDDRLYMVTYKQIDPFFAISLEDPRNPEVLGELKIPGWSDYLHPYDEDHIIGVGKQANEDGTNIGGVKVSLFDVSDVENPIEEGIVELDADDSEALRDHKAFLFDSERSIIVLPATERGSTRTWEGAYIISVNESGLSEDGRVTHKSDENNYWGGAIKRSLYIDDALYTMSEERVRAHSLVDYDLLGTIELPYEEPGYGNPRPMPEPMPVDDVAR